MSSFSIRPADIRDLPVIFRGERQYMVEVEPDQQSAWIARADRNLELWIENLDRTVIAALDGDDAGYLMWRRDGPDATLITVHVGQRFRGQGVGRYLLSVFVEQAFNGGAQTLRLSVHTQNGARVLYEHAGFRLTGIDGQLASYALEAGAAGTGGFPTPGSAIPKPPYPNEAA